MDIVVHLVLKPNSFAVQSCDTILLHLPLSIFQGALLTLLEQSFIKKNVSSKSILVYLYL